MRVLIIGAGAVSQVLAFHLHRGGSAVTLLRRRPAPDLPSRLYDLRRRDPWRRPLQSPPVETIVEGQRTGHPAWDQVYLCVPSDALRPDLLGSLAPVLGGATVVKLQPGLFDRSRIAHHIPEGQLVSGMVTFMSFQAPLVAAPGLPTGYAFWIPPLTSLPFSGDAGRTGQVVRALRRGGLATRAHPDVESLTAFLLALQAPLTAGFECAGESLPAMRAGPWLRLALDAAGEARTIASRFLGRREPWFLALATERTLSLLLSRLPRLFPFPFEAYLTAHYRKLRRQSQQHLEDYLVCGDSLGLPVRALSELADALRRLPARVRSSP